MYNVMRKIGNVPLSAESVASYYTQCSSKSHKVSSLEQSGKIIRLKRGLYVPNPEYSGVPLCMELIANHLCQPSYVSLQSALRFYGLIPERVYNTTSVTTKVSRSYTNKLGTFTYTHCNAECYYIGIVQQHYNDSTFLIATPEKALCDLIGATKGLNLRYKNETYQWLEEDIRFDMDSLKDLDVSIFQQYLQVGLKKPAIEQLIKLITR